MKKSPDPKYPGRCPCCNCRALRQTVKSRTVYCTACRVGSMLPAEVDLYQAKPRPDRGARARQQFRQARSGSGVIAGRIEVGRGWRWGAGW